MPYKPNKTHSKRQRERILALIETTPMTCLEISAALPLSLGQVKRHIDLLHAEKPKRLYIDHFKPQPQGGTRTPRYLAGNKPDAVFVSTREMRRKNATRKDINDQNDARVLALLEIRPMTSRDLVRQMKRSESLVRRALVRLREAGRIYVSSWASGRTQAIARYSLGNLPDVERTPYLVEKKAVEKKVMKTGWAAALGL